MAVAPRLLLAVLLSLSGQVAAAVLSLHDATPPSPAAAAPMRPGQLPHSRLAQGTRDIAAAWLAGATDRYAHGVLGDDLEASRLMVETREGNSLRLDLPQHRVFEDLEPRLVDLDGDGRDEILVVESDASLGAALAVYGRIDGRLALRAMSPFIGRAHRWLNPVGAGDFDGDGKLDLALVATPHIGGILRLYRFEPPALTLFAETGDVSTHRMGRTELGLGQVAPASPRARLLLPDPAQRALRLLEWEPAGMREIARGALPARLDSSLIPAGRDRWRFRLEDGRFMEVRIRH
jgi:hypothetical protein